MSIIGTIRNKFTWLLLLLVGFAILAFLLMDGTSGQGQVIGANKAVGKLEGGKITALELQDKIAELRGIYPDSRRVPDDQLETMAWNELIDQQMFAGRYNDLGISVTKQEMADLLKGENPHPYALQVFASLSEDGQYNQFKAMEIVNDPSSHPQGELAVKQLYHAIMNDKMTQKYASLLQNGVHTPSWVAENDFVKEYKTVNFDYVFLPYSLIDDNEIEVTDSDLLAYAKSQNGKYEAKDGVILQYVPFDQSPSKADTTDQMIRLQNLKDNFNKATNVDLFASSNSNSPFLPRLFPQNIEYQTKNSMQIQDEAIENQIVNANVGDIVGPFKSSGELIMVKVVDKKQVADSARVRHILIQPDPTSPTAFDDAKNLADSLANELRRNKSKFGEFVTTYSTDPGSKDNGGVYEYFPQGQMVPSFNDYSFNGKIGEIGVVETSYGFHIVEPLARKGRSTGVKIAPIVQSVKTSKATRDQVYAEAKEFERMGQSPETFETEAAKFGGAQETTSIERNATAVPGIGQSYELMQWLNNNPVGTVRYFNNINGRSYVMRIKEKTTAGQIDLNRYRAELTTAVRNEKKAAMLNQQVKDAGGADQNLSELATSLGRTVQSATEAKFGQSGNAIGFEPELISSLFFLSEGQVNRAIEGRRGVYLVDIKSYGNLPPEQDFAQYKTKLNGQMQQKANINSVRNAMVESGKIKDERYKTRY